MATPELWSRRKNLLLFVLCRFRHSIPARRRLRSRQIHKHKQKVHYNRGEVATSAIRYTVVMGFKKSDALGMNETGQCSVKRSQPFRLQ